MRLSHQLPRGHLRTVRNQAFLLLRRARCPGSDSPNYRIRILTNPLRLATLPCSICANDGTTYKSECELRKIACLNEMDLRALFYGECDDADEPGGAQQLPGDNGGGSGDGDAEDGLVAEERAPVVAVQSARARDTCAHHRCAFGGLCRYNAHGQPFCACHFDCEGQLKRSRGRGEKVCAEGRVFTSECALREESCKRQIEIMRDESCAVASLENDDQSGKEPRAVPVD